MIVYVLLPRWQREGHGDPIGMFSFKENAQKCRDQENRAVDGHSIFQCRLDAAEVVEVE